MTVTVAPADDGMLLSDYLRNRLGLSRMSVTRLKQRERGLILNGVRVTVRAILRAGDTLELDDADKPDETGGLIAPVELPFDIIYEDTDIIAANKPAGMPTHPSHGHLFDTLANAAVFHFAKRGVPFVFRAVNRLDRDTSGVVLLAKNKHAAYRLGCAVGGDKRKTESIKKEYFAVLRGIINPAEPLRGLSFNTKTGSCHAIDSINGKRSGSCRANCAADLPGTAFFFDTPLFNGVIDAPIRRAAPSVMLREVSHSPDAARAVTEFSVISIFEVPEFGVFTIVRAYPQTGRTHQLRVHFAYLGCPVAGDTLYGVADEVQPIARQALHCMAMTIGGTRIEAPLPDDILTLIQSGKTV